MSPRQAGIFRLWPCVVSFNPDLLVPRAARVPVLSEVLSDSLAAPSAVAVAAAREVWGQAAGTPATPIAVMIVAELVSDHLRAGLSRWVGVNGSSALLARAVRLVV